MTCHPSCRTLEIHTITEFIFRGKFAWRAVDRYKGSPQTYLCVTHPYVAVPLLEVISYRKRPPQKKNKKKKKYKQTNKQTNKKKTNKKKTVHINTYQHFACIHLSVYCCIYYVIK